MPWHQRLVLAVVSYFFQVFLGASVRDTDEPCPVPEAVSQHLVLMRARNGLWLYAHIVLLSHLIALVFPYDHIMSLFPSTGSVSRTACLCVLRIGIALVRHTIFIVSTVEDFQTRLQAMYSTNALLMVEARPPNSRSIPNVTLA